MTLAGSKFVGRSYLEFEIARYDEFGWHTLVARSTMR